MKLQSRPYVQAQRSELYLQNYENQSQVIDFLKFTTAAQKPFIQLSATYNSSKLQIFDNGENRFVLCFSATQFARNSSAKLPKKFFGSFFQKRTYFFFVTSSEKRIVRRSLQAKIKLSQFPRRWRTWVRYSPRRWWTRSRGAYLRVRC